jgi:phosphoenolpyruvate---glycerone phosphotransferase subunit DhaL
MDAFSNSAGRLIVANLIETIQRNKQHLSDIDGLIGDGDHGINMNKGFSMCAEALKDDPGDLTRGLNVLSKILMTKIGGSMGPLYGFFFESLAKPTAGKETIDAAVFGQMLNSAAASIGTISDATVGEKTLVDTLAPAVAAYDGALASGACFGEALDRMKDAATEGRDSTRDMIAKKGRASRLGERSRGVLDPGATSCCLILCSMADSIRQLIET